MLVEAACLDVNDHESLSNNLIVLRLPSKLKPLCVKEHRGEYYFWYSYENMIVKRYISLILIMESWQKKILF